MKAPQYNKDKDPIYLGLLRLANIDESKKYTKVEIENTIKLLTQLPNYVACHWRLIPLLNMKVKQLGIERLLPKHINTLLKVETQKGIAKEIAREQQLNEFTSLLSGHGIPVILLKGSAFAKNLYPANAPRLCNDIDLLIREEDWSKALDLISIIATHKHKNGGPLDELIEVSFTPKNKLGFPLDIHSQITYPKVFNIDYDDLWLSSVEHPYYQSQYIRILSNEYAAINLAVHAFVDVDIANYGVLDLYELCKQKDINLEFVSTKAKEIGCNAILFELFQEVRAVFQIDNIGLNIDLGVSNTRKLVMKKFRDSFFCKLNRGNKNRLYRFIQFTFQYVFATKTISVARFQLLFLIYYCKKVLNSKVKAYDTLER